MCWKCLISYNKCTSGIWFSIVFSRYLIPWCPQNRACCMCYKHTVQQVTKKQLATSSRQHSLFVTIQQSLLSPVWILPLSADWYLLLATPIPVHNLCGHSKMLPSELLCQAGSKEKQVSTFNRHLQQWIRLSGRDSSSAKKLEGAYDTLLSQNKCNKYKNNWFCF